MLKSKEFKDLLGGMDEEMDPDLAELQKQMLEDDKKGM